MRMRDPVPFWPRDPGWVKIKVPSGHIPDHIFKSLETIFGLKTLKFFDADSDPPGWKKFGSGIDIPNPQHCGQSTIFPPQEK